MAGEEVGVGAINQFRLCAAQMGATPADRSKVALPDQTEDDPPTTSSTEPASATVKFRFTV